MMERDCITEVEGFADGKVVLRVRRGPTILGLMRFSQRNAKVLGAAIAEARVGVRTFQLADEPATPGIGEEQRVAASREGGEGHG